MPFQPSRSPEKTVKYYVAPGEGIDMGPQKGRRSGPDAPLRSTNDEYRRIVEDTKREIAAEQERQAAGVGDEMREKVAEYDRLIREERLLAREALKVIGIAKCTLTVWRKRIAEEKKSDNSSS